MKQWIIVAWDMQSGKGTAVDSFNGTYEEAVNYVRNKPTLFAYGLITLNGVVAP